MIYLLRHAERIDQSKDLNEKESWNKSLRYKNNLYDIPLSLNGVSQAYLKIGKILKNFKGDFDYIYCSPMTRCVQSALQFQKYIFDNFKKLVLIRVEYGLAIHLFKEYEMFWLGSNIKLHNDKFVVTKIFEFIDKYLERDKIYKRYGVKRFDLTYTGIITREQINLEQTYTDSISSRINTIKKIATMVVKTKLTIVCAHCETCHLVWNYINKKWTSTKDAPKYSHVGGLKLGVKSNKLIFLEMIN
jgi:bisphosphoglycerate-dependent phosphoglycerate mutase